jgi:hypothetical protein
MKPISHVQIVAKPWARLLLPTWLRRWSYFRRQRGGKWWLYRIRVGMTRYLGGSQDVRFVRICDLLRYDMIRYRGGNARTPVAD